MIPRLRAEEALGYADVVSVGSGACSREAASSWINARMTLATGHSRRAVRASSVEGHAAALQGMGITAHVGGSDG